MPGQGLDHARASLAVHSCQSCSKKRGERDRRNTKAKEQKTIDKRSQNGGCFGETSEKGGGWFQTSRKISRCRLDCNGQLWTKTPGTWSAWRKRSFLNGFELQNPGCEVAIKKIVRLGRKSRDRMKHRSQIACNQHKQRERQVPFVICKSLKLSPKEVLMESKSELIPKVLIRQRFVDWES